VLLTNSTIGYNAYALHHHQKKEHFMNAKNICFLALAFIALAFAAAQTGNEDYWIDENGNFHQMLRWSDVKAPFYDVDIEKRDPQGVFQPVDTYRSEKNSLETMLPSGVYRFRIVTYNALGRAAATSDWTPMTIYPAKPPAAVADGAEIVADGAQQTVTVTGSDIVEDADIYFVPAKKGAEAIKPEKIEYSFDEKSITAVFPAGALKAGKYDITITNPGGLKQTLEDVPLKIAKAPSAASGPSPAGEFNLDNSKNWSLGLEGRYGRHTEKFSGNYYGADIRWDFLEIYREYGKWSWLKLLPNAFFVDAAYWHHDASDKGNEVTRDLLSIAPGFLWKLRLGKKQRWLLDFGIGVGLAMGHELSFDDDAYTPEEYDGAYFGMDALFTADIAFRITPSWEIKLGVGVSGEPLVVMGHSNMNGVFYASLGAAYRAR
jgi:hypothetical protein